MSITLRVRGECKLIWLTRNSYTISSGNFFLRSSLYENPVDDPPTFSEVFVDGVSVEFTQSRHFDVDQYYYIDVVIPNYTEDAQQHEIKLVRYARDDVSGEEIYQNHLFYTQFKERNLLTLIGDHLFRDEEFEKPVDLYLGLLTSLDPPVEVLQFCSGNTTGTTDEMVTGYERKLILPSEFQYFIVDQQDANAFVTELAPEYIKNAIEIRFSSFIEECEIVGMGIYLSPFDALPVFTTTFAYPLIYTVQSPDPINIPQVETWMTPDVVIRTGQFQFNLENSALTKEMRRLICEHVFLKAWTGLSLADNYRLATKPIGFYFGLIVEVSNNYYYEPTRTDSAYARVFYTSGDAQWELVSDGVYRNKVAITFPTATINWGTVIGYAVYRTDAYNENVPNDTLLFYKELTTPVEITLGMTHALAINAVNLEIF